MATTKILPRHISNGTIVKLTSWTSADGTLNLCHAKTSTPKRDTIIAEVLSVEFADNGSWNVTTDRGSFWMGGSMALIPA